MPPLVTALHDGRRRVVAAANPAAGALGLLPGLAIAQALAIVPGLQVMDAQPGADAQALERLARWCHRATPLASAAPPDGLWLDVTGCAHLWGGEAAMLQALVGRLARDGLQARAAVADTPGAAHALARYGRPDTPVIVPSGEQALAMATLPIAALRLPPELVATLRRLGFEQVSHLARIPRAPLARRFGVVPGLRLDQALGRVPEPLEPLAPEQVLQSRDVFLEPLLTAECLASATALLMQALCEEMERTGLGARQIDLLFERVDNQVVATRIGTARPSRNANHLVRLLNERLDTIDPGLGVEAMRLVVSLAEPLEWEQQDDQLSMQGMAKLIDQLANRLGDGRLYQAKPLESDVPERTVQHATADFDMSGTAVPGAAPAGHKHVSSPSRHPESVGLVPTGPRTPPLSLVSSQAREHSAAEPVGKPPTLRLIQADAVLVSHPVTGTGVLEHDPPLIDWKGPWTQASNPMRTPGHSWPGRLHAPPRLLDPPRRIEALAALPDHPPLAFTWRRCRHRIRRADGPERIHGEWWRHDIDKSIRDYYQVENEHGQRFWLYRLGNGSDLRTGDLSWFLHGLF